MIMANKFLINSLSSISMPLSGIDVALVERSDVSYKVSMQDIYKDVLSNRLAFKVGRTKRRGCSNELSLLFINDNGTSSLLKSVTLQDGMLSSVEFNSSTNHLSLHFNSSVVSDDVIDIDLDSLEDRYFAGYGLGLSETISG